MPLWHACSLLAEQGGGEARQAAARLVLGPPLSAQLPRLPSARHRTAVRRPFRAPHCPSCMNCRSVPARPPAPALPAMRLPMRPPACPPTRPPHAAGVRVPDSAFIRAVCRQHAGALALTSANISQGLSPQSVAEFEVGGSHTWQSKTKAPLRVAPSAAGAAAARCGPAAAADLSPLSPP